jgi:hypothetical protein
MNASASIHDRARALAAQACISITAAYQELSRRSAESRKRRACTIGTIRLQKRDAGFSSVESPRHWLPYSD